MAQQEEGWPLGLQPLNVRVGLPSRNGDFSGSISFNTLHTASPPASFTDDSSSSSDLDTESTGSFFHDRSITLGSLIGASSSSSSILKAASRARKIESVKEKEKKSHHKTWMLSLCSRDTTDAHNNINIVNVDPPSLGHFLAAERRAANESSRRNNVHSHSPNDAIYGSDELALADQSNTLFVNGEIAPPRVSQWHDNKRRRNGELGHDNEGPVLFLACVDRLFELNDLISCPR